MQGVKVDPREDETIIICKKFVGLACTRENKKDPESYTKLARNDLDALCGSTLLAVSRGVDDDRWCRRRLADSAAGGLPITGSIPRRVRAHGPYTALLLFILAR